MDIEQEHDVMRRQAIIRIGPHDKTIEIRFPDHVKDQITLTEVATKEQ